MPFSRRRVHFDAQFADAAWPFSNGLKCPFLHLAHVLDFRVGLVPKGPIPELYPIQSNPARSRPLRCAAALAWILQGGYKEGEF